LERSVSFTCALFCFLRSRSSAEATGYCSLCGLRIVHGQVLYRDFFELVTPGTDLLYAAGFKLFGVHAWILQAWTILLGVALSCVITSLACKILTGLDVFLPAILFLVFDFAALDATQHWYSTLAVLVAVRVLFSGHSLRHAAAAGFFSLLPPSLRRRRVV
jgi:hypothetical protein